MLTGLKYLEATALVGLSLTAFLTHGQSLKDDFSSYPAGSDAAPNWQVEDLSWTVRNGGYEGSAWGSVWSAVPYASALTFACDVTVQGSTKGDWLTAGIGIYGDGKNFWGLNLVAAPEKMRRQHSAELAEMLGGTWLAQGQGGSRLEALPAHGWNLNWQTGQTYHLEVTLTTSNVAGRILCGSQEVFRAGYRLNPSTQAVRAGRPVLRASGLLARFENATVTVQQTAPEPKAVYPQWVSRSGKPLAAGTGFFRTCEVDGRWWLLDPEGKRFFDVGADHITYQGHWCEKLGYAPYHRNAVAKYGTEAAWAQSTLQRFQEWGFNTLPAGHSASLRHQGAPHILFASMGAGFASREWICERTFWTGFPDVFSPNWQKHCRIVARGIARQSLGDPWCIGTFLDNELEWYGKKGILVNEIFGGYPQQAAKKAFYQWLVQRFGSLDELNRRLGTAYAGESAFLASTNVPPASETLDKTRDDFLAVIAERYFSIAAGAMREADPQHLVLGCRFAGRAPEPALAAAGKYNDVFTFNTYPRVDFQNAWLPDGAGAMVQDAVRQLGDIFEAIHKPVIITEWGFPALDSGLPCRHGAGMRVDTQEQKAACYRIFANTMAGLPFVVGYHYFMWEDEPALGISSSFPEDSNYGLVNEQDVPYETLVKVATEVNRGVAARHAQSSLSGCLHLLAEGNAAVLKNTNPIASHGLLRISVAGSSRTETVNLQPGQSRRLPMPAGSLWCSELQNWDTTVTRLVGGNVKSPCLLNIASQPLNDIPVVLDEPAVSAFLVHKLGPGAALDLPAVSANALAPAEWVECKSATITWSGSRRDGSLFDSIRAGDFQLGKLLFATHQLVNGQNLWVAADAVTQLEQRELPDAWVIEAVVKRAPARSGQAGFQARVRAIVFKQLDLVLVRPLWVENTDSRPWRLEAAYWFCRSSIGGAAENDVVGGPGVPNYYAGAQFITDSKLGGCLGAFNQPGGWRVQFWADETKAIHPDSRFVVEQNLRPGQRWTAGTMPYLWVYASRSADAWKELSRKERQAAQSLVTAACKN